MDDNNMRESNNENAKLEKCEFHRAGLEHLCKEDEEQHIPEILARFGVVSKAVQSKPKEEDKVNPYWASSHEYDTSVENWGKHEILVTEFKQSGLTHHFGVISLGMAMILHRRLVTQANIFHGAAVHGFVQKIQPVSVVAVQQI